MTKVTTIYVGDLDASDSNCAVLTAIVIRFLEMSGTRNNLVIEGPTLDPVESHRMVTKLYMVIKDEDSRHPGHWPMMVDPKNQIVNEIKGKPVPITINGVTVPTSYHYLIQQLLINYRFEDLVTKDLLDLFFQQ